MQAIFSQGSPYGFWKLQLSHAIICLEEELNLPFSVREVWFPPSITSFPCSGNSLYTGQCFSTQEIPRCFRRGCENLGEASFTLSPQSHAICISLFLRLLLGPFLSFTFQQCLDTPVSFSSVAKNTQGRAVMWQPPETFTYLWSCLCKEHRAGVPPQQGNHKGQMHHHELELQHLQRRTIY